MNIACKLRVTNETTDDECGECDDAQKGDVDVHTIYPETLLVHNNEYVAVKLIKIEFE